MLLPRSASRSIKRGKAACERAKRRHRNKLCVLRANSLVTARRLATSPSVDVVVVERRSLPGRKSLQAIRNVHAHVLIVVSLGRRRIFDTNSWTSVVADVAANDRVDLGVAPLGRYGARALAQYLSLLAKTEAAAPDPPSGLALASRSRASLAVRWSAVSGAQKYGVYSNGKLTKTTAARDTTLTGLGCGVSYLVQVDAVYKGGDRSAKATLDATTAACPTITAANLWIDTSGGSCTRQASPSPYNDGAACASFAAAYAAASSGDLVGVRAGVYPPQLFAGGSGGSQGSGTKTVTFRGEPGTILRRLHVSSPNLNFDGLQVDAGGARLDGTDGAVLEMGDADNSSFRNGSIGNVVDQKGALIDGKHMTFANVVFHDVVQQSDGVHNECLFAMVPDYLVLRDSTFRNCATFDVNMNWPDYWSPQPPSYGHVTLENNVFGHSVNGSGWHYYGFLLGGTGPNSGAPACAKGEKAATYMVGWVVRYNTFENDALFDGCASGSRWVGNLGSWDCMSGMSYSHNLGTACGPSDISVSPASSCAPPACAARTAPYGWVNPGAGDFHLLPSSVAINKGDPNDFPSDDRDGKARTGVPDAGAYQR